MDMSSTAPITAWQNGCFRAARAGRRKLLFGCMYEDAEIELRVFQPGGRIFCIASAGCTAMKLAARHTVVAVDINPVQVAYVQERLGGAAIQRGSAERILGFARTLGPLAGWNRRRVRAFLDLDDPEEQILLLAAPSGYVAISCGFFFSLLARRFFARFTPLRVLMFCRRISELYYVLEWSGASRCTPTAGIRMHMPCFLEICPLRADAAEAPQIQLRCADAADFLERQPRCELHWIFSFKHSRWSKSGVRAAITRCGETCCYTRGDSSAA